MMRIKYLRLHVFLEKDERLTVVEGGRRKAGHGRRRGGQALKSAETGLDDLLKLLVLEVQ